MPPKATSLISPKATSLIKTKQQTGARPSSTSRLSSSADLKQSAEVHRQTLDWVVALRKLVLSCEAQDKQLKRLKTEHESLKADAVTLQRALGKAGLIPKSDVPPPPTVREDRAPDSPASPQLRVQLSPGVAAGVADGTNTDTGCDSPTPARQTSVAIAIENIDVSNVWEGQQSPSDMKYTTNVSFTHMIEKQRDAVVQDKDLWEVCQPVLDGSDKSATSLRARMLTIQHMLKSLPTPPDAWAGPVPPLIAAVTANHFEMAQLFLRANADLGAVDHRGHSVLHIAAFKGSVNICRALLQNKADVNVRDPSGQTPLFFAPRTGVCKVLVEKKAELKVLNLKSQSALHVAAHNGFTEVLTWLSSRVARSFVEHHDNFGQTAESCLKARSMVRKDPLGLDRFDLGYKSRRKAMEEMQAEAEKIQDVDLGILDPTNKDRASPRTDAMELEKMYKELENARDLPTKQSGSGAVGSEKRYTIDAGMMLPEQGGNGSSDGEDDEDDGDDWIDPPPNAESTSPEKPPELDNSD